MARITHPRPQRGSQKQFGIVFHDGFADVDDLHPVVAAALVQHGFTIEDDFAIVELADGTVVGDGTSIVTLNTDGTANTDSAPFEQLPPADDTEKVSTPRKTKDQRSIAERLDAGATLTRKPDGNGGSHQSASRTRP
jgi:hypothetical protein